MPDDLSGKQCYGTQEERDTLAAYIFLFPKCLCAELRCGNAFADFADLHGLISGFDFVQDFDAGTMTNGAFASAMRRKVLDTFSTVVLCHFYLPLNYQN